MADTPTAYPLAWPIGWPRTKAHHRDESRFNSKDSDRKQRPLTMTDARERLAGEMDRLHATSQILSTNLELRLDGSPRAGQSEPADPGAAAYFQLNRKPLVFACDRWLSVSGNVAAIAAHLAAMRSIDRWGVGSVEQLYTGYTALPAPLVVNDWRTVLGDPRTLAEAESAYRERIRTAHPDAGGSHARAATVNAAIIEARKALGRL